MVLIAGCGFVGSETVRQLRAAGREVAAVTHSEESAAAARAGLGICAYACDIGNADAVEVTLANLSPEVVISCVSSGRGDVEVYRRVYFDGCVNLIRRFPAARLIFVSSTSVYAQNEGQWVDETSPAEPRVETGRVLVETETLVRQAGGMAIRPGGIYGPGRSILLKRFFAGEAVIESGGDRYLNQVHRDDVASALAFLASHGEAGEVYNVTDDCPLTQLECYEWLAERFGRALPPPGQLNPNRKRGVTNKRVSNAKLRALGWAPGFSSFREGAVDCVAAL